MKAAAIERHALGELQADVRAVRDAMLAAETARVVEQMVTQATDCLRR